MKVTQAIKEEVALLIEGGARDAEAILTDLVEFGTVDEEYELICDAQGIYNEAYDREVQAAILNYIQIQLLKS